MKLVVFDIDGTLTQTNEVDSRCFEEALRIVLGVEEFDTCWENYQFVTDSGVAQEISQRYRDRPINGAEMMALHEKIVELLKKNPMSAFAEIPGAVDFFQSLVDSEEFAVALATGANKLSARYKLETAGINFEGIPLATSSDAVVREHIMLHAMDRASQKHERVFSEIVYFGDAVWDVKATENLGWQFIGIGGKVADGFIDYRNPEEILKRLC